MLPYIEKGSEAMRLLVVEDDNLLNNTLCYNLSAAGYTVDAAMTKTAAVSFCEAQDYDLIILDVNLPDGNGFDLCEKIKERRPDTSVIFLTANDTEKDMIEGFQAGCDDYIAKPFSVELLNQRIMAVLRRSAQDSSGDLFHYKDLSVDFGKMQVSRSQVPVKLSVTEYRLLELLIKNKGQVLTRESILGRIWDCDGNYVDENTLNVHIRRLRQKIEPDTKNPQYIITVFGIGYTFGE